MNEIIRRLDRASSNALRSLLGFRIQTLLSDSADITFGSSAIEVMSVSVQLGLRNFLILQSAWGDTPKEWLNYHCLSARLSEAPRGITYKSNPQANETSYCRDHLEFHLGAAASIASIDVLEAREVGDMESVTYDAGVLITRVDGMRLCVVRAESNIGALRIVHDPRELEEVTDGLRVGIRFAANDSVKPTVLHGAT